MIDSLDKLTETFKYESTIYGKKRRFILVTESDILYRHLVLLRKAEYHSNVKHKIRSMFYKFFLNRLQNRYALHVPINTCGKGLNIAHVGPIVINKNASIGENVRIHVGVNIGSNGGNDKAPHIGNNVYIGPGAKIFGDITITDNIKIGANAVVNRSCLIDGATLVGVPARAHKKKKKNNV